ncbi:MAG: two pore domain potassium channel family protein [Thermoleophilaceae bacterium]|nr:two pore domain potassium channel family protein [Thermoleophilaceae bacterium]
MPVERGGGAVARALLEWLYGPHRYGRVLVVVAVSIVFALAVPEGRSSRAVLALLQGLTLVLAMLTSDLPTAMLRPLMALASAAALASAVAALLGGDTGIGIARILSGLLVVAAPAAIGQGVFRRIRHERRVTIHLLLGVLAIYLLIGVMFAFADGAVDRLGARDFLRGQPDASLADFLYFSFATLTTTGYGDLVPGNNLARSFATVEALTGQIYLVTVVAVLVGNLAPRRE